MGIFQHKIGKIHHFLTLVTGPIFRPQFEGSDVQQFMQRYGVDKIIFNTNSDQFNRDWHQ